MPLTLTLAAPGRGKTHACLAAMAAACEEPGGALILLVPEQATDMMERRIQDVAGVSHRLQVSSFQRLSWRIAQWTEGAARRSLDDSGRHLLLHGLLRRHRSELEHFGRLERPYQWAGSLLAWLAEFRKHGLTAARLRQAAARAALQPGDVLAPRLRDAALLMEGQDKVMEGGWKDEDLTLGEAMARMGRATFLAEARVWIDGFQGFTPLEEGFVTALLRNGNDVTVTLPLDPARLDTPEGRMVYALALETRERLRGCGEAAGIGLTETWLSYDVPGRFAAAGLLDHVVRHWGTGLRTPQEPAGRMRLLEAPDRTAEAEGVMADIVRTVREGGWRWREVAILVRDVEEEGPLLERAARRLGVPLFVDRRRPVENEGLIRLVRSLIAVWAHRWPTTAVMDLLRNDLSPVPQDEVDQLENRVIAEGWDHQDWSRKLALDDPAKGCPPGVRRTLAVVREAGQALGPEPTVRALAESLVGTLERLDLPGIVARHQDEAVAEGRPLDAEALAQAREILLSVLDQWVAVDGEAIVPLEEAMVALGTTLASQSLAHVPATLDQVLAGTVDRTRTPELRGLWLMGLTDGHLPAPHAEAPLLDDADRRRLEDLGCPVGPDSVRRQEHERLRVLHALTRAADMLTLSRPVRDSRGRDLSPSPTWMALRQMVPALRPIALPATHALVLPRAPLPEVDRTLLRMPRPDVLSASRLEAYAACPWLGFTRHVLKVEDRKAGRVEPLETGRLLHLALETFVRGLHRDGARWRDLEPAEERQRIRAAQAALEEAYRDRFPRTDVWSERALARLLKRTDHVLHGLGLTLRLGKGEPVGVELGFGPESSRRDEDTTWLPPLYLPASDGEDHVVGGRIDRVDVFEGAVTDWLVVLDYKSGTIGGIVQKMRTGEYLQLPLYLAAVTEAAPGWLDQAPAPGGFAFAMLHIEAEDEALAGSEQAGETTEATAEDEAGDGEEEDGLGRVRPTRMKGRVVDDADLLEALDSDLLPGQASATWGLRRTKGGTLYKGQGEPPGGMEDLLAGTRALAGSLADRMTAGEYAPLPVQRGKNTPCRTCPVRRACRFRTGRDPHREVELGD
ncbi:MAG: PD-(D/E)XK nuclease family protein [Candidatus Sericytochromatia bacterium]|nr:PD-(D/E)XK nuclease family protein [Candidatus Sericytochromatia bacterium]